MNGDQPVQRVSLKKKNKIKWRKKKNKNTYHNHDNVIFIINGFCIRPNVIHFTQNVWCMMANCAITAIALKKKKTKLWIYESE